MRLIKWRWLLPVGGVVLAAVLFASGQSERAEYLKANNALAAWDYAPPAVVVADAISYPAFVAASILVPSNDALKRVAFLICAGLLWHAVGLQLDRPRAAAPRSMAGLRVLYVLGAVISLALGALAVFSIAAGPVLLGLAGVCWSVLLLRWFVRHLLRGGVIRWSS